MTQQKNNTRKLSIWQRLFPGLNLGRQNTAVDNAAIAQNTIDTAIGGWLAHNSAALPGDPGIEIQPQENALALGVFPRNRLARYSIYDAMAADPTIDSAIKMHVTNALSADMVTGDIVSIESTADEDDPITIDLRNTFKTMLNNNCQSWAYNVAKYGVWFVRVYGAERVGVKQIRSDYYTHPRFNMIYERAGQLAGYTSAYQGAEKGLIQLMEPWKFVEFKTPQWDMDISLEPVRYEEQPFDLALDDTESEGLVESQNYGQSLIATAFGPWLDLLDAIQSLTMSRKNAARLERLVGVNTGKLSPQRAAEYLGVVAKQLQTTEKRKAEDSFRRGYILTTINRLIPIWGDGKGRLEISTVEGNPNIESLADVEFHIHRLGSALGVDPSLLGFGEQLSGGLGDGGFFRMSVIAAMKATQLRRAITTGIERLFDIHVAYKHGQVFPPGQKPWRVMLKSVATAIEQEEMQNRESRINYAMLVGQLLQTIDPEMQSLEKNTFNNWVFTDLLKMDEEKFKMVFKKVKDNTGENPEEGSGEIPGPQNNNEQDEGAENGADN
jgi:hypothetical protein